MLLHTYSSISCAKKALTYVRGADATAVFPACSLNPPTLLPSVSPSHPSTHTPPTSPSQDAILSIATTFDLDTDDVIPTSAKTGEGIDEARCCFHTVIIGRSRYVYEIAKTNF